MASPTVSVSLNKASFAPGEQILATITYGDVDNKSFQVTVTVTDQSGNVSAPATVAAVISDATTITVADDGNRVWTKVSDTGSVAVFRAVA